MPATRTAPTRPSLLDRLKDWQNEEGWRDFCANYRGLVHGFAIKRGLSESEAEDIVQDTFLSVAKSIGQFQYDRSKCTFKTWLMTLTSKRIADLYRRRSRQGSVHEGGEHDLVTQPNSKAEAVDSELERQWDEEWDRNLLETGLERLKLQIDARQFGVFYLHVIKEQPAIKVAKSYEVNLAYVYLVKHRVKLIFKRILKQVQKEWC